MSDNVADYDYDLPREMIARYPPTRRDEARLLVVDRSSRELQHRCIADLPNLLRAEDLLVLNDTRVIPARILGKRAATGGRWEGLFLETGADGLWRLLSQTRGKLRSGETVVLSPVHAPESPARLSLQLLDRDDDGVWAARPVEPVDALAALQTFGTVPLPPYMGRELPDVDDFERYQTQHARAPGSVAAPTAGLHFTPALLDDCAARSIDRAFVTLHVGIGTFRPITAERLGEHRMHAEWCEVPAITAQAMAEARSRGGRVVAVGTTTTRTLESAAARGEASAGWCGATDLFIRPPYQFRSVDALVTNFHLPRSTLLVMVAAFADRELILHAYHEAMREGYRFYSYGDAMLIV